MIITPQALGARAGAGGGGRQLSQGEQAAFIAGMFLGAEEAVLNEPFDWWAFFLGASAGAAAIVISEAIAQGSGRRWQRR